MTALTVVAHRRSRHAKPNFSGVRTLVSVKIPKSIDRAWDWAERYPRFAIAALFLMVAVAWAVRSEAGAMSLTGVAAFILGRGVGIVRAVALKDKLAEAERELVAARIYGEQAAAELAAVRADLAALTAASTRTQRLPTVEDGQADR